MPFAAGNVGANATAASSTLLGRWVPTMVATSPNRRASSGAAATETATAIAGEAPVTVTATVSSRLTKMPRCQSGFASSSA